MSFANPESVYARTSGTRQYSVLFKIFTSKIPHRVFNKNWITIVKRPKCNKEAFDKRRAECEALQDNLNVEGARNAEQEQSIYLFKQEMADLKINAAKIAKPSRKWRKRLNNCARNWETTTGTRTMNVKKNTVIDQQKNSLRNEKAITQATEKCLLQIRNKDIRKRTATLNLILLLKISALKDQINKHNHKMSLLTHPHASGDED